MPTKTHKNLTKEEWLQLRTKYVNSTEVSALYSMNPYMSELELFHNKRTGTIGEFQENKRMRNGKILEPGIAEIVHCETGYNMRPFKEYLCDNEDLIGSSFDYLITDGDYKDWVLEIKKVAYLEYKKKWNDDEAPDHIEVQVQHQMELANKPGAIIAAWVGGDDLKLIYRERNREMGKQIRTRVNRFWHDVENNIPPEPDYMLDAEFIVAMSQNSNDEIYIAEEDGRVSSLLKKYKQLQEVNSATTKEMKSIKAEVFDIIGDNGKVQAGNVRLSCGMTKENPGLVITQDMIGQRIGGCKSYRNFRVSIK